MKGIEPSIKIFSGGDEERKLINLGLPLSENIDLFSVRRLAPGLTRPSEVTSFIFDPLYVEVYNLCDSFERNTRTLACPP